MQRVPARDGLAGYVPSLSPQNGIAYAHAGLSKSLPVSPYNAITQSCKLSFRLLLLLPLGFTQCVVRLLQR